MRVARPGVVAIVAVAVVACLWRDATAQLPALPGGLAERGAAAGMIATLRAEIDRLSAQPPSATRDVALAYRRVAFDALFHGLGADPDNQALCVAGIRLGWLREQVDGVLAAPAASASREDIDARLVEFARAAAQGMTSIPPPARPEETLRSLLRPLREAVALAEGAGGVAPSSAWPDAPMLGTLTTAGFGADATVVAGEEHAVAPADSATQELPQALATVTSFDDGALRAGLRPTAREIRRRVERSASAVQAWIDAGRMDGPPPEANAVREAAADLRRLTLLDQHVDVAGAHHAPARDRFRAVTAVWGDALRDRSRRDAARRSIDAFEAERAAFVPMPLEAALRRGSSDASAAVHGRGTDVLAAIDRCRASWITGWLDTRGSPAAREAAERWVRLLSALQRIRGIDADALAGHAHRWGGLAVPTEAMGLHPKALAGRGAIALEAALAGDASAVDRQLQAIDQELPLAEGASALARVVDGWASRRPGVGALLDAAIDGPPRGAWMADRRAEWMLLSRLLAEDASARATHDAERSTALRAAAGGLLRTLLGVGAAGPSALP